jgi:hypothetical protein
VTELVARVRRAVAEQVGPNATFEQRREVSERLMAEALAELAAEAPTAGEAGAPTTEGER